MPRAEEGLPESSGIPVEPGTKRIPTSLIKVASSSEKENLPRAMVQNFSKSMFSPDVPCGAGPCR